jgi:hypothetical protein
LDRVKIMSKIFTVAVYGGCKISDGPVLSQVLHVVKQRGGRINCFNGKFLVKRIDLNYEFDYLNQGDNPLETVEALIDSKVISGVNVVISDLGDDRYYFLEEKSFGVIISCWSNYEVLANGKPNFNWQYEYWESLLGSIISIEGIEITEFL